MTLVVREAAPREGAGSAALVKELAGFAGMAPARPAGGTG